MIAPRSSRLIQTSLTCALALTAAGACGPDFFPDTFVRTARPDNPQAFVQGRLGLLQPGSARADLFVAFRYLNGGSLDKEEQKAWQPTYPLDEQTYGPQPTTTETIVTPDTPIARWVRARHAYPGAPPGPIGQQGTLHITTPQGYQYEDSFLNCADDAFRVAAETFQARARTWGKTSPYLADWLNAQDIVFSNCSGPVPAIPSPVPSGSPALLEQDRAYQIAAAHFYSRDFASSAQEFLAISRDPSSPWQPGGGYLAGRVLLRQAFFARPDAQAQADYDPVLMHAAEDQLRASLTANPAPAWHDAAEKQLALVRIRLEPEQRTRELAASVSGPGHDSNYAQDLQDLLWITAAKTPDGLRASPRFYEQVPDEANPKTLRFVTAAEAEQAATARRLTAFNDSASERALAPILDWTLNLQSLATTAPQHALVQWQTTHALPWLVAALILRPNSAPASIDLLNAAATVPATSPAWETVSYHRARLLIASGDLDEARTVLSTLSAHFEATPAKEREPSTENALHGLEMAAAPTTVDLLHWAPRPMLLSSSEEYASVRECLEVMKNPARHYACLVHMGDNQFDTDAATLFNTEAPLTLWLAAAQSASLSPQLRDAVAEEGWTRSILLGDNTTSASFLALMPPPLRAQAQASALAPWITLARNPGLRPYLNSGTQRAYSYDFVESYRDNWCYAPETTSATTLLPAALTNAERSRGQAEAKRLADLRSVYVGQRIVQAVKAKPHDQEAAEALFLVLRMIRYGCTEPAPATPGPGIPDSSAMRPSQEAQDLLHLKKDAARLLREHYAGSPWTKKAAPFAG